MAVTRRSTRLADTSSSPVSDKTSPKTGSKRKAEGDALPKGKRGKKSQKTIEETMPGNGDKPKDIEMKEAGAEGEGTEKYAGEVKNTPSKATKIHKTHKSEGDVEKNGTSDTKDDETAVKEDEKKTNDSANGHLTEKSAEREKNMPTNIIEKGIIYFFTRGRVGIEEPESVQDLQRTYFVMRPIPSDAKLADGAIDDSKSNRLVALPKKVLPKSGKDRFMAFVEKGKASMKELREDFFSGSEYETKTVGTRHTPPVSPIGEGVYAIIEVGRSTHLAYILTIPEKPDQVQVDMGLREKGSFVISLKNPTRKGPANAQLPQSPDFPQEILDDFRGLAWIPVHKSEYLDYPNAQLLLIGEHQEKFGSAVEATEKDKKQDKETPQEELEKLEDEDQIRIEHLHGDDTIFDDLHISKEEYPSLFTKW